MRHTYAIRTPVQLHMHVLQGGGGPTFSSMETSYTTSTRLENRTIRMGGSMHPAPSIDMVVRASRGKQNLVSLHLHPSIHKAQTGQHDRTKGAFHVE